MPRPKDTIKEAVLARIAAGEYRIGQPLPTGSELADEFQVTTQTVRNALRPLLRQGTLYSRGRGGTFVARHNAPVPARAVEAAPAITATLRARLADGTYPAGAQLPVKETQAAEFGVCIRTLDLARKPLLDEGLLITVTGSGTFAAGPGAPHPTPNRTPGPEHGPVTRATIPGRTSSWRHVQDTVLARIDDHTYPPGTRITAGSLAPQFAGVASRTIHHALASLVTQGRLRSRRGNEGGYVVTESGPAPPARIPRQPSPPVSGTAAAQPGHKFATA
ncbi:GntR family transcriptional regulator [Streptomyces griseiscabiei]|uniref:GntR family transcriptional regulator n=1 Tax=Streptomyces griseiscabiei TaxID=2993540 RepID=A0ABU4LMF0_9ACTN|nr:GntR family transcriptional regulator [Streptomyces griseiscabiei]MBZ3906546.1 GntR family transcriptional regulator [Streptomyces griseiscabiei]MDX2916163.1 GntR family transcriptional regulator [Streptomyces griseiscabiei]